MIPFDWVDTVQRALAEDVGQGDMTTRCLIDSQADCMATLECKQEGVLAGLAVAEYIFTYLDSDSCFQSLYQDGDFVVAGTVIAEIRGKVAAVLTGERVALNFLQRLSGVATRTAAYVAEIKGTQAQLLDTRKTTPGLRGMEKYAVVAGGGHNHRFNLADGILIKDNHIAAVGSITDAITKARFGAPALLKIEVEVENMSQLQEAIEAKADMIMLDNMDLTTMREAVKLTAGRVKLEASGGVRLNTIRAIAETGVDYISVGALTHSAPSIDISLTIHNN